MKSIDVFCHLMPQKYAELAMNESPNKSHMFVRALKMQAMSDMEYRKQVMEGFDIVAARRSMNTSRGLRTSITVAASRGTAGAVPAAQNPS